MAPLPPDLSRLGDELTAAAARSLERRRRRRLRVGAVGACAVMVALAVLASGTLRPPSRRLLAATPTADATISGVVVRLPDRRPVGVELQVTRPQTVSPAP